MPDDIKYKIKYKEAGGAWTEVFVNTNTFILTGLTPNLSHKYKLKTKCSGGWTNWSAKYTFTTLPAFANDPDLRITPNDFSIFPNPVQDVLTVSFTDAKQRMIRIADINGKVVLESFTIEQQTSIQVSTLAKGIYFLSVDDKVQKFIK